MMIRKMIVTAWMVSAGLAVLAQDSTKKKSSFFGRVSSAVSSAKNGSAAGLSSGEIVTGLKEAPDAGRQKERG